MCIGICELVWGSMSRKEACCVKMHCMYEPLLYVCVCVCERMYEREHTLGVSVWHAHVACDSVWCSRPLTFGTHSRIVLG